MAKTRLNQGHREFLRKLMQEIVTCPEEVAEVEKTYAAAEPLVRKAVEAKYPAKDMKVLRRYEAAKQDDCIKLQLSAGGVEMFHFKPDTGPIVAKVTYQGAIYLADEKTTDAVQNWIAAREIASKRIREKHTDYEALIEGTNYLEDIEAVWPEAAELRKRIAKQLPAVLSEEVVKRIKADSKARAALAAAE